MTEANFDLIVGSDGKGNNGKGNNGKYAIKRVREIMAKPNEKCKVLDEAEMRRIENISKMAARPTTKWARERIYIATLWNGAKVNVAVTPWRDQRPPFGERSVLSGWVPARCV